MTALATPAAAAGESPRFLNNVQPTGESGFEITTSGSSNVSIPVRMSGEVFMQSMYAGGSSAFVEYDLARQCTAVSATLGIDEIRSGSAAPAVNFTVKLDGTVVETKQATFGKPVALNLPATNALRVRIEVSRGASTESVAAAIGNLIALCSGPPIVPSMTFGPCFSPDSNFEDVPRDHPHFFGISCLNGEGIANGTSESMYSPSRNVNRGQMAAFLARVIVYEGGALPPNPPDAFDDDNGSIFEQDINQLAAVGVVRGGGERRYLPLGAVSRGQMSAFLARTFAYQAGAPLAAGPTLYSDTATNTFAADIARVSAAALASGYGDGRFGPDAPVTRGQIATFVSRLLHAFTVYENNTRR